MEHERQPFCRDDDEPVSARANGPNGKLDAEVKSKVDSFTLDQYKQLCAEVGTDPAGMIRDHIYLAVYGKTYSALVAERQHTALELREMILHRRGHIGAPDGAPKEPG